MQCSRQRYCFDRQIDNQLLTLYLVLFEQELFFFDVAVNLHGHSFFNCLVILLDIKFLTLADHFLCFQYIFSAKNDTFYVRDEKYVPLHLSFTL